MARREDLESYAILLGGGLFILGLVVFAQPSAPRSFTWNGAICDPQGVMAWLNRKLLEDKITAADVQRLLNTDITVSDWIDTVWGKRGFNIVDLDQLMNVCASA